MPRAPRHAKGGLVYHLLNRANGRSIIFRREGDYLAFERILVEAKERCAMRIVAYCVMPNHWHLVVWPRRDGDLSVFLHWLTLTHAQRWQAAHDRVGGGHLYQGRFKSFPVQTDEHYLTVCRYVEQNPVRARLVRRAQDWRWSSAWRRLAWDPDAAKLLSAGPLDLPEGRQWLALVNRPVEGQDLERVHTSIKRGRPLGQESWLGRIARMLQLESTLRPRGRPRKETAEGDKKGT